MKKYFSGIALKSVVISSAGLVLGTTAVRAQEMTGAAPVQPQEATPINVEDAASLYSWNNGFYIGASLGVNFPSQLSCVFEPFGGNTQVNLNPGVSCYVTMGYDFKLGKHFSLAPEVEAGIMYNSFGNGSSDGVNTSGGGDVIQVPVLINVVLNYKITPRWSVYAGFGLGEMYTDVNVSNENLFAVGEEYGSLTFDLKAGVQCKLGPGELGLGYRYVQNIGTFVDSQINNNVVEASYTIHF